MLVKNHMSRPLILQVKTGTKGLVYNVMKSAKLGRVVIPPGQVKEVPFWDQIKQKEFYQRKMAKGDITTGNDGANIGITNDFTSFGDTLKPPPNLDQNRVKDEADNDSSLAVVDLQKSVEDASPSRRRGRPRKDQTTSDVVSEPQTVADMVSDIGE